MQCYSSFLTNYCIYQEKMMFFTKQESEKTFRADLTARNVFKLIKLSPLYQSEVHAVRQAVVLRIYTQCHIERTRTSGSVVD